MELVCIGVSHKSAPLELREQLAIDETRQRLLFEAVSPLAAEMYVLSTCNRVEVYALSDSVPELGSAIRASLDAWAHGQLADHAYEHRGEAALVHLFRVAASLDSMVVGEAQILGQVKDALEVSQLLGQTRTELGRICAACFGAAKRVRTETAVGQAALSLASVAVDLAVKVFTHLSSKRVLVVGAGEMGELAAKNLQAAGVVDLAITNRTPGRAKALADALGAAVRPYADLQAHLTWADVIICSTAAPAPVLTVDMVQHTLSARRHRPLLIIDLAVPRDVAPEVHALSDVYVYNVDDLQKIVAENLSLRSEEAIRAEELVSEEVARFVRERSVREGVPVLGQLRAHAENIARLEVEKTVAKWGEPLSEKHRRGLDAMAMAIVNKLLHEPTLQLRQTALQQTDKHVAKVAARLFGLAVADDDREVGPLDRESKS